MKLRSVFNIGVPVIVLFFYVLFVHSSIVDAMIGVSPAYYEVDFEPNLKHVFHFDFFTDDKYPLELYADGDLAEYVELSKKKFESGGGDVNVLLTLPDEIDLPGVHTILIGARQKPEKEEGFGIVGDIKGVIRVKVPYPGKYAAILLETKSTKAGEPAEFKVRVNNLGKEDITASTSIVVFDSLNQTVAFLSLSDAEIKTAGSNEFISYWNTSVEQAGLYTIKAITNYGGKISATDEKKLRLGELYLNILNNSDDFTRDTINKFEIEVESYWNDPIDNVFAEVSIPLYSIKFLTPSASFKGFEKETLTGYFDTAGISEDVDEFKAKISVKYEGKVTEKIVTLRFNREVNYMLYAAIAGIVIALIVLIGLIIWLRKINKEKANRRINHAKRKT